MLGIVKRRTGSPSRLCGKDTGLSTKMIDGPVSADSLV